MKKLVVVTVILLAIIALGVVENRFISSYYSDVAERLDSACYLVESGDFAAAMEITDEVIAAWEEKHSVIHLLTNHNNVRELCGLIITARLFIERGEEHDALANLTAAAFYARELAREAALTVSNIF